MACGMQGENNDEWSTAHTDISSPCCRQIAHAQSCRKQEADEPFSTHQSSPAGLPASGNNLEMVVCPRSGKTEASISVQSSYLTHFRCPSGDCGKQGILWLKCIWGLKDFCHSEVLQSFLHLLQVDFPFNFLGNSWWTAAALEGHWQPEAILFQRLHLMQSVSQELHSLEEPGCSHDDNGW